MRQMTSEETEDNLDDVLKQSEELLNRIQENQNNGNDLYDGVASLPSIGSALSGSYRELQTPTSMLLRSPAASVQNSSRDSVSRFPSEELYMAPPLQTPQRIRRTLEIPSPVVASPTIPPAQEWEKVSSATQGDDDYVPIVDYTKEKVDNPVTPKTSSSKVSRLETYRRKAQLRKRRQRRIGIALFIFLGGIYWVWTRKGKGSSIQNVETINATADDIIVEEKETKSIIEEPPDTPEKAEVSFPQFCDRDIDSEFEELLEEFYILHEASRCANGAEEESWYFDDESTPVEAEPDIFSKEGLDEEVWGDSVIVEDAAQGDAVPDLNEEIIHVEENQTPEIPALDDEAPSTEKQIEGKDEERTNQQDINGEIQSATIDIPQCNHPLARFFVPECRKRMKKDKKRGNPLVKNAAFLVV